MHLSMIKRQGYHQSQYGKPLIPARGQNKPWILYYFAGMLASASLIVFGNLVYAGYSKSHRRSVQKSVPYSEPVLNAVFGKLTGETNEKITE